MLIDAAVALADADTLTIETLELQEALRGDELRVKLVATGICHTDLKQLKKTSIVPRPVVLGHEGVGIVEAVGASVKDFAPGDTVVMSVNSCGSCPSCANRLPGYCVEVGPRNFSGTRPDGTTALSSGRGRIFSHFFGQSSFATHSVCTERNAVKVDAAGIPLAVLAPLGCGVQTGVGSVLNSFNVRPGQSLVVFGAGAVGLSAVMAGRLAGAGTIVAVDLVDSRLELASELGASVTLRADCSDLVQSIRSATRGGADFALDTTGVPAVIDHAVSCLAVQGTCGLLASPTSQKELAFAASPLILGGRKIQGIVQGSSDPKTFIPRMIELHRQGKLPFDRLIRYYPFSDINQAIHDAHSGEVIKPVLTFT